MKQLIINTFLSVIFTVTTFSQIPADRKILLNAEGAGQAKYAENNGYPGPKHVLELAQSLSLTKAQHEKVQSVFDEMREKALDVGKRIVAIEEEFNLQFSDGLVNEKNILAESQEIGRLRGELRAIHLNAHLITKRILNQKQIQLYTKLRTDNK